MRIALTLIVTLSLATLVFAADEDERRDAVRQRAMEKAYQRQIAKEWALFTEQFVIRQNVPVYSGPYQIGWRVVATPNYPALREYQRRLEVLAWNSMTDQEKRDYALFTIARNTGVIAANTGLIVQQNQRIAQGLDEVHRELRSQAAAQMIQELWPRSN